MSKKTNAGRSESAAGNGGPLVNDGAGGQPRTGCGPRAYAASSLPTAPLASIATISGRSPRSPSPSA